MGNLYVGVGGTARKVSRLYVGVGGVARRVKKLYVGVNGVARKVFGGEPSYYGTATSLSKARCYSGCAVLGNYAIFAGGWIAEEKVSYFTYSTTAVVDAYDRSLTRTTPTELSARFRGLAATTVGNYALFSSGMEKTSTVNVYSTSLTRSTATSLSASRSYAAAAHTGNYALFGGGYNTNDASTWTVDAYNASLTRSTAPNLSNPRARPAATQAGSYAVFAGGYLMGSSAGTAYNYVDAYDGSLTRSTITALAYSRYRIAATNFNAYALFGGGVGSGGAAENVSSWVDIYNASLTHTTTSSGLSVARYDASAASTDEYVLFGGGQTAATSSLYLYYSDVVDAYDTSFTRSLPPAFNEVKAYVAAAAMGGYVLFAGGSTRQSAMVAGYTDVVDVYEA